MSAMYVPLPRRMHALTYALVIVALSTSPLLGQWPAIQAGSPGQPMTVGGGVPAAGDAYGRAKQHTVAFDSVGNVYVVGKVKTANLTSDIVVVSYDRRGLERWRRTRNGSANQDDCAYAVAVDSSGNVYVAGMVSNQASSDGILLSYDTNGVWRWESAPLDLAAGQWEDVVVDASNNVYVTGWRDNAYLHSNSITASYNSGGGRRWLTGLNPSPNADDNSSAIALDGNGGVYVSGRSVNTFLVAAYEGASGAERWWRSGCAIPSAPSCLFSAFTINLNAISAGGGRVVATGVTGDAEGGKNIFSVGFDITTGAEVWAKELNRVVGKDGSADSGFGVVVDGSGNAYVTGQSASTSNNYDCYTISYDPAGAKRWEQSRDNGRFSVCYAAALDSSGNVYVAGHAGFPERFLLESYTPSTGSPRWRSGWR